MFTPFQSSLIQHVAHNLWRKLGSRALVLTDAAVARMCRAQDEEGLDLWLAIHAGLVDIAGGDSLPDERTVH